MQTTIDLDDDLIEPARALAAERRGSEPVTMATVKAAIAEEDKDHFR